MIKNDMEHKEEVFKDYAIKRGVPIIRDESHDLLRDLVKKQNPKHILEIGTAVGYSGITMLESSNADLVTIEKLEESYNDCSLAVLDLMIDDGNLGKFDFIFLDGPKAQYLNLLPSLYALLTPSGMLVADNVLFRGYVENPKSAPRRYRTIYQRLKKFIDYVFESGDFYDVELYRVEDGVLVAKKKNV